MERGPTTGSRRRAEIGRETVRLLPLLLPVIVAELVTVTIAASAFAASQPSASTLAGVWALLIVTVVAEAFPVPLENVPVGGTSLATIFIVGTSVIYGWSAAVIVAFVAQVVVEIARRRDLPRVAYNSGVYALGAAATSVAGVLADRDGFGWLALETLIAAMAFYAVDLLLVALVVSRYAREPFGKLLAQAIRDLHECLVADGMPVEVVDLLEVVHVEEADGERMG
jgi:hypothetical protein